MDLETWHELELVAVEEPENWSGPLDVGELGDLAGAVVTDTPAEDWTEPLDELARADDWRAEDALPEEDADEREEGYPEEAPLVQEPAADLAKKPKGERVPNAGSQAWSAD